MRAFMVLLIELPGRFGPRDSPIDFFSVGNCAQFMRESGRMSFRERQLP